METPLARNRYFWALVSWHDMVETTPLFAAGVWLLGAIMVAAFGWPSRATPSGAFAVGVATCAIAYVLTYAVFGVATDFRYSYWCVLATLAGAPAALAARRERPQFRSS